MRFFYADTFELARLIQDRRVIRRYSANNFEFGDHTSEDFEQCKHLKLRPIFGLGLLAFTCLSILKQRREVLSFMQKTDEQHCFR